MVADGETGLVAASGEEDEATGTTSVFGRPLQRLSVEFKVHRYSAPVGTFTTDGSIWRLVAGPLPDATVTLNLADNGFRAAIGRESDRAPVRAFLEGIDDLRSALDYVHPDVSRSVELDLGPCRARQVVFYHGRNGSLRGLDFVQGRAKLMLTFEMRSLDLHAVWLRLVPAIEEPPGPLKWVMTEVGPRQEPQQRRHSFDALAFGVQVPAGGFLLLGGTEAVHQRPLVATPFFVEACETGTHGPAGARESIYVVSPIIRSSGQGSTDSGARRAPETADEPPSFAR